MPSKGLDFYFVNTSNVSMSAVALNADGSSSMNQPDISNPPSAFCSGNCQINTDLPFHLSGSVSFTVNGNTITEDINGLTGNTSGALSNMMNTPSVIASNYNLSYGFFDAGTGAGTGLTNQDQIYAYLTPPQQNWMGRLASQNTAVNQMPFSSFVLPGAHDAGTFDLTAVNEVINSVEYTAFLTYLAGVYGAALAGILAPVARGVIIGEAVTQKDNITTMLNLGCRYFDFRPGKMPSPINTVLSDIYHIHAVVPGYSFQGFLTDILNWLKTNTTEIVVINLQTAGFINSIVVPQVSELQNVLTNAQNTTDTQAIQIGATADSQTPYEQLIATNKRLFILNTSSEFSGWNPASKYDSYNDNYNTTNPENIITALEAMNIGGQAGNNYTVLQLQGTPTGQSIPAIIVSLIASLSNAYEPLMSTKAKFDSYTYPWLLNNETKNLGCNQLVVVLNDFVDNALAEVAISLTQANATAATLWTQYVPAGSYQSSSSDITVTLSANCLTSGGGVVPSQLTYSTDQAEGIGDIPNVEGVLSLSLYSTNSPNPTNQFGGYVPAGSYQLTSSGITVTISANCLTSGGTWLPSELTYSTSQVEGIKDITNIDGKLTIVN